MKFRLVNCLSQRQTFKQQSKASLQWCSQEHFFKNFLTVIIKTSAAEIIFSKVPYFKHILLNYFRRICLMYENYPLRDILFLPFLTFNNIQVAAWNYKSLIAKTVENKKGKSYLGYKEQKKYFLSSIKSTLWFCIPIILCLIRCASKITHLNTWVRWIKFV